MLIGALFLFSSTLVSHIGQAGASDNVSAGSNIESSDKIDTSSTQTNTSTSNSNPTSAQADQNSAVPAPASVVSPAPSATIPATHSVQASGENEHERSDDE